MGQDSRRVIDLSIRFEKCQYIQSVDDEVAEDEDEHSVLLIKHLRVVVCSCCSSSFSNNFLPSDKCTCRQAYTETLLIPI